MSVNFSLEGKTALVTGASYGIGFAIASGMAKAGATIVFNDIKQELVDKGIAAYKEAGIEAHGYVCDVTNEDAVNEIRQVLRRKMSKGYLSLINFDDWEDFPDVPYEWNVFLLRTIVNIRMSDLRIVEIKTKDRRYERIYKVQKKF